MILNFFLDNFKPFKKTISILQNKGGNKGAKEWSNNWS